MKYLLMIVMLTLGTAAVAHPHHDCSKDHSNCGQDHTHPGEQPK